MINLRTAINLVLNILTDPSETTNRAHPAVDLPRESKISYVDLLLGGFGIPKTSYTCISIHNHRLTGVAIAKEKASQASWEITGLILNSKDRFSIYALMDDVSKRLVARGAERIFLRLLRHDPFTEIVLSGGFKPYAVEVLYRLAHITSEMPSVRTGIQWPAFHRRSQADTHGLFDLYTTVTPVELRSLFGVTLAQWEASQDNPAPGSHEFVFTHDDRTIGWLRSSIISKVGHLEITVTGEDESQYHKIISTGLSQLMSASSVYCLVPERQSTLRKALLAYGFQECEDYWNLIKVLPINIEATRGLARTTPMI